jgi:catechol 2,3-dioxygenase-like lactoylglutathione lyase family enzyme
MLDHVSLQCADVATAAAFYDTVLAPLGGRRLMDFGRVVGYGTDRPSFWLSPATSPEPPREVHVAFVAEDRDQVDAFFEAAKGMGAELLHEPRLFPEYHPDYYGAFVRDPDGNNCEAVCHSPG